MPVPSAKLFRVACLGLALALLAASCSGPQQGSDRDGARGGTLRVLSSDPFFGLDTADSYGPTVRPYARTLYGYNLAGPPEQKTVPVSDIASGPPQLSADQRTYTFTLRPGVRYAPRSTARSPPPTSSPPSNGSTTRSPPLAASSTRT
jgi:ABC-type transport system substrate-binding protein